MAQVVRRDVALEYANRWEIFFKSWRNQQARESEKLFHELLEVRKENLVLKEKLDFLTEEALLSKEARQQKEIGKTKRRMAEKQALRDVVSREEFGSIISLVKTKK